MLARIVDRVAPPYIRRRAAAAAQFLPYVGFELEPLVDFLTRELVAYGLIGITLVAGVSWYAATSARRKREKLRRKGIKRFGH